MIHILQHIFHIFLNWSGSSNPSGNQYGFWSGFGSDIGEITLIGAVIVGYRKINCHVQGCRRIGHYPLEGTPYKLCAKHSPHVPSGGVTHHDIIRLWTQRNSANAVASNPQKSQSTQTLGGERSKVNQ